MNHIDDINFVMMSYKPHYNWPFPSCSKPLFQIEAKCEACDTKMVFYFHANKTHFHKKGFALCLVLKVRVFGTRKWLLGDSSQSVFEA